MGYSGLWLDYQRLNDSENLILDKIYYNSENRVVLSALAELKDAIHKMRNIEAHAEYSENIFENQGILLYSRKKDGTYYDKNMQSYRIEECDGSIVVSSDSAYGVLYGVFELIRMLQCGKEIKNFSHEYIPDNPLRMLDHWDNADGSIERGYSGKSFFFEDGRVIVNERTKAYARLAASVGINAVVINNVNVNDDAVYFITDKYFDDLRKLSEIFADYGIKLFLSVNYASSVDIGGLISADPLDEGVSAWWRVKAAEIYREIPNFGGFLVKADSEGRVGPFTYGRTHAEGANMLARALEPFGGIVIWRCFVYNCYQDWRDRKTDRARAGYDNFIGLDKKFEENVILQIKNGPMDFQVREPVSPLFGAMPNTNQMLEVQIAQEYTGQQIDLCYLIPWFKEILSFHTGKNAECDTVADYIGGKAYGNKLCGIAAVCNTGNDYNWTGHDLAAANLYGFGRLSFDPSLTSEEIAEEWIQMTYGSNPQISETISELLMKSWLTYEKYTAPLGVGWMVAQSDHYGVEVDSVEYSRWGTYHYADRDGIGVDRTREGTGYVDQYNKSVADFYNDLETCPDNLILFFHHLPYTYVLKSGKTIIQHIYDSHFEGVEDVLHFIELWNRLKPYIDSGAFTRVSERLQKQLENAVEWRDVINTYFYRKSGVKDDNGRKIY